MKVYRGPSSKPFYDDSHEFVSTVPPDQLEEGIRSSALIRFNITKDGYERQAVCTAQFEETDLIPMIRGLLTRLTANQECLKRVMAIVDDDMRSSDDKLIEIQATVSKIR